VQGHATVCAAHEWLTRSRLPVPLIAVTARTGKRNRSLFQLHPVIRRSVTEMSLSVPVLTRLLFPDVVRTPIGPDFGSSGAQRVSLFRYLLRIARIALNRRKGAQHPR